VAADYLVLRAASEGCHVCEIRAHLAAIDDRNIDRPSGLARRRAFDPIAQSRRNRINVRAEGIKKHGDRAKSRDDIADSGYGPGANRGRNRDRLGIQVRVDSGVAELEQKRRVARINGLGDHFSRTLRGTFRTVLEQ
jgi:hypothetical protein